MDGRGAPAEQAGHYVAESVPTLQQVVVFRQRHGVAKSHTTGNDRNLAHRVTLGQHFLHHSVACLVVGNDLFFFVRNQPASALRAGNDALDGLLEFVHGDLLLVASRGQDRGFIDQVFQVGSRKTGGSFGKNRRIDIVVDRCPLHVDP